MNAGYGPGFRTPFGAAAGGFNPSLGGMADTFGPLIANLLRQFLGVQLPGMGGGGGMPLAGMGGARRIQGNFRDRANLNQILNGSGGMGGVSSQDTAAVANYLRGLGLENVNPQSAMTAMTTAQGVLGSMFPSLGPTAITDLMGGMSSDYAKQLYRGSGRVRGQSGYRLSNQEIRETTNLVTDKARGGPGGGLDFNYTRGMTLGEIGEISAGMGERGMLGFDPRRAGSVAHQVERDTKDMIDTIDELRGLWDSPDAPITQLLSSLDDMLGGNAGGMKAGSLKSLVKDISATATALGVDSKQLMTQLTDAGARGQQSGIGGRLGVQIGIDSMMSARAFARGSGAKRNGDTFDLTEDDAAQYVAQQAASAMQSEGGNLTAGLIRAAGEGVLNSQGASADAQRFFRLLGSTDKMSEWSAEDTKFWNNASPEQQMAWGREGGLTTGDMNVFAADTPSNLDQYSDNPGARAAVMSKQVDGMSGGMADYMISEGVSGYGAAINDQDKMQEVVRMAIDQGVTNGDEMAEVLKKAGVSGGDGAKAYMALSGAAQKRGPAATADKSSLQVLQAMSGNAEQAKMLQQEKEMAARTAADIEEITGANGKELTPGDMMRRGLSHLLDPESDGTADGFLKAMTNTPDQKKLDQLALSDGSKDLMATVAGLDEGLAKYNKADELNESIRSDEELLKTYKAGGATHEGNAREVQSRLDQNRAALKDLGDVTSPEAKRDREVMQAARDHAGGQLGAVFGADGLGGAAQEYNDLKKSADDQLKRADELKAKLENGQINQQEYEDGLRGILESYGSDYNGTETLNKNFGDAAGASIKDHLKTASDLRSAKKGMLNTGAAYDTIKNMSTAVNNADKVEGAVESPARIIARATDPNTPEEDKLTMQEAVKQLNEKHNAGIDPKNIKGADDLRKAGGKLKGKESAGAEDTAAGDGKTAEGKTAEGAPAEPDVGQDRFDMKHMNLEADGKYYATQQSGKTHGVDSWSKENSWLGEDGRYYADEEAAKVGAAANEAERSKASNEGMLKQAQNRRALLRDAKGVVPGGDAYGDAALREHEPELREDGVYVGDQKLGLINNRFVTEDTMKYEGGMYDLARKKRLEANPDSMTESDKNFLHQYENKKKAAREKAAAEREKAAAEAADPALQAEEKEYAKLGLHKTSKGKWESDKAAAAPENVRELTSGPRDIGTSLVDDSKSFRGRSLSDAADVAATAGAATTEVASAATGGGKGGGTTSMSGPITIDEPGNNGRGGSRKGTFTITLDGNAGGSAMG